MIARAHQGRGLGEQVVRQLIGEARGRGVPLWLSVYLTNPARRLYARLGFVEHSRDAIRVRMAYPSDTPGGSGG